MSKIAVIDIGSNSVRMVIFDAMARAPHYIYNEKALCRLGEGLSESGHLSTEGVRMAKSELERHVYIAQAMNVSRLEIVATAAVREATDGPDFVSWIEENLGQTVRVLSGEDEAKISAQGVLLGWPDAHGVISDMGGSSMELVAVQKGRVRPGFSTRLGPLRLEQLDTEARKQAIQTGLDEAGDSLGENGRSPQVLYLVGGSWRAFAKCDMVRKNYPFPILHEYAMSLDDVQATLKFVKKTEIARLNEMTGTSLQRLELLPHAARVLKSLVEKLKPQSIAVSSYGLREGLLYENMPRWMRDSDPLIAAAEALENENARVPGYGRKLFDWLSPLRAGQDAREERLTLAACLLHDINWRFHPDFRAQMSYEIVAQANICGVTHKERIFLALALASRYTNRPDHAETHPATALLDEREKEAAWSLGRAMRLGAMLSGSTPDLLTYMQLEQKDDVLILNISREYEALYGVSVEKRLSALGKVTGRDVQVLFS